MPGIELSVLRIGAHLKLLSALHIRTRYAHVRSEDFAAKRVKNFSKVTELIRGGLVLKHVCLAPTSTLLSLLPRCHPERRG